jgi:polyhydroxybutyrate depolymerase
MKKITFLFILNMFTLLGQTPSSITIGGVSRSYIYYTPSSWNPSQNVPLLIVLHGLTQTGAGLMDITQFNQIAEQNGFIVAYPDGENFAWNANMNLTVSSADDMGFIEALAQEFQNNFETDPLRQYLVGFSNGGFMSHRLACESSMCFAAIATVSGNMSDTTFLNCQPQFQPAVMHIHGTSDLVVPYNGGSSTGVSVDQCIEKWRTVLNCDPIPNTVNMPNTNLFDFSTPQRFSYINGTNVLELIKIEGGGHQWPGIQTLVGGAGIINMDFYSPDVIWEFLNGKSCPSNAIDEMELKVKVYPNPSNGDVKISNGIPVNYSIFNIHGKVVMTGQTNEKIDIEHFDCGVYYIQIDDAKPIKLIKTK